MLGFRKSVAALSIALPLLLTGCSSSSSSSTGAGGDGAAGDGAAGGGRSWVVVDEGKPTTSPVATFGTAPPTPALTLPPLPSGSVPPTATPSSTCTPMQRIKTINGLAVDPGSTDAVVTWYHPGGANIVDYRVTAVSQRLVTGRQKESEWTRSVPAKCGDVSATITGLDPGTPYVFTVDAVLKRANFSLEGTYTQTIARSAVVSTT